MGKGIGPEAATKLSWFARVIHEFFGEYPYHVGSSLKCSLGRAETYRDVDVRLILDDEHFDALFGELTRPRAYNLKWNAACLAFTALGKDITGLFIDFQIDRSTEANEKYGSEPRSALIPADHLANVTPTQPKTDCAHINAYRDDFLGEWHCDDCGATLDGPPGTEGQR